MESHPSPSDSPTPGLSSMAAPAVSTADLFATPGDAQNPAAVRAVRGARLDLVGLAVHGPKNAVDEVMRGAVMHS